MENEFTNNEEKTDAQMKDIEINTENCRQIKEENLQDEKNEMENE
jgi:hypothetical protein